jgi:hypothetical protein
MKKVLLTFIGAGIISFACAQQTNLAVIAPSGNSDTANGVVIDWTMGELAIMSLETPGGFFTQGFHQPNISVETLQVPNLNTAEEVVMTVRPNPVSAKLLIDFDIAPGGTAMLTLMNMEGALLKKQQVALEPGSLEWNTVEYPAGIYILSLRKEDGTLIRSFKIVKNH